MWGVFLGRSSIFRALPEQKGTHSGGEVLTILHPVGRVDESSAEVDAQDLTGNSSCLK